MPSRTSGKWCGPFPSPWLSWAASSSHHHVHPQPVSLTLFHICAQSCSSCMPASSVSPVPRDPALGDVHLHYKAQRGQQLTQAADILPIWREDAGVRTAGSMASVSTVERIAQSRGQGPCSLGESQNCSQVEPSVREKGGEAWKSPFLASCPLLSCAAGGLVGGKPLIRGPCSSQKSCSVALTHSTAPFCW